ncbi:hypothetical protein CPC08DRAFT_471570 [Agrocybe pediades]|nr:hypothetical protein CPC08DRAFT_471570 [Agrocybe pediades]
MSGSQKARWGRYLYGDLDKPDFGPKPMDLDASFGRLFRGRGVDTVLGDKTNYRLVIMDIFNMMPVQNCSDTQFKPTDVPNSVMEEVMVKKSFEPLFQKLGMCYKMKLLLA